MKLFQRLLQLFSRFRPRRATLPRLDPHPPPDWRDRALSQPLAACHRSGARAYDYLVDHLRHRGLDAVIVSYEQFMREWNDGVVARQCPYSDFTGVVEAIMDTDLRRPPCVVCELAHHEVTVNVCIANGHIVAIVPAY